MNPNVILYPVLVMALVAIIALLELVSKSHDILNEQAFGYNASYSMCDFRYLFMIVTVFACLMRIIRYLMEVQIQ